MKTDDTGGPSAEDKVAERLSRRYSAELERAERDYPVLMRPRRDPVASGVTAGSGRSLRAWRRLAALMTVVVALVAVGLVGVGIALRPSVSPAGPSSPAVVRGSDGIPTSIDGQRVYGISDKAEWQNLSGSFLLAAYATSSVPSCPSVSAQPSAEVDLLGSCTSIVLAAEPITDFNGIYEGSLVKAAPRGSEALTGFLTQPHWLNGPAVVMRVHTHDQEAAQCAADQKAACEGAVVVEAVIWPTIPTEINGERVYRAVDLPSLPAGSFLLGGPVAKPSVMPPCPAPIGKTAAEQQLIPYCFVVSIDGLPVAPMSNLDEPNGEIVVARVHVKDQLAAECSAEVRTECEQSVVVESVVWRSSEDAAVASPSSAASTTIPGNPASGEAIGPVQSAPVASGPSVGSGSASAGSGSVGPLDSEGIPTTIGGAPVYRAATLPTGPAMFLLGGSLTHDTGCAPAVSLAPPACGYWMVDGVEVGASQTVPESLSGSLVVARVSRMSDCQHAPCATPLEFLSMGEIVWSGSASAGSGSVGPLDSDGVPTSIAGASVFRAATLPTGPAIFLLGGPLTHDTGCAPTIAAVPPGCGYWMVDGVKVGTMIALPESPSGFLAVVRVAASTSIAVCPNGKSCPPTRGELVVTELVWSGPTVVAPPPASPVPSAS